MVNDFLSAAFPWVLVGIFAAIACSFLSSKKREGEFEKKQAAKAEDSFMESSIFQENLSIIVLMK